MKNKAIKVLVLLLAILSCFNMHVSAYCLFGNKLVGGVGNSGKNTRYYWLSDSAQTYTSTINAAMYSWNHTATSPGVTTPIWFEPVGSKTYSVMDIYTSSVKIGAYGSTSFYSTSYDNTSSIEPEESNWRWCQIYLYTEYFSGTNLISSSGHTLQSTVAHEMGHVFGLDENNSNENTIMAQAKNRSESVVGPAKDDCRGINAIYS